LLLTLLLLLILLLLHKLQLLPCTLRHAYILHMLVAHARKLFKRPFPVLIRIRRLEEPLECSMAPVLLMDVRRQPQHHAQLRLLAQCQNQLALVDRSVPIAVHTAVQLP
jgi:hypothetical protein